jgi:tetratricopeptide (TPR) repeat protein
MLYCDDEEFDIESLDGPRLTRLQVERRAIEIARDAVNMRRFLLFGETYQSQTGLSQSNEVHFKGPNDVKWYDVLDLASDLLKLGTLLFRRCDYEDAIDCWKEALALVNDAGDDILTGEQLSRAIKLAVTECQERRIDIIV